MNRRCADGALASHAAYAWNRAAGDDPLILRRITPSMELDEFAWHLDHAFLVMAISWYFSRFWRTQARKSPGGQLNW
jgi:hypothetical protein